MKTGAFVTPSQPGYRGWSKALWCYMNTSQESLRKAYEDREAALSKKVPVAPHVVLCERNQSTQRDIMRDWHDPSWCIMIRTSDSTHDPPWSTVIHHSWSRTGWSWKSSWRAGAPRSGATSYSLLISYNHHHHRNPSQSSDYHDHYQDVKSDIRVSLSQRIICFWPYYYNVDYDRVLPECS